MVTAGMTSGNYATKPPASSNTRCINALSAFIVEKCADCPDTMCSTRPLHWPFSILLSIFHFYGPDKAVLDKTWKLPDIESTN